MSRFIMVACLLMALCWLVGHSACQPVPSTEPQSEQSTVDSGTETTPEKKVQVEARPEPTIKEQAPEPTPFKWAQDKLEKELINGITHVVSLPAVEGGAGQATLALKKAPDSVKLENGKLVVRFTYQEKDPVSFEVVATSGNKEATLNVTLTPRLPVWTKLPVPATDGPPGRANPAMALAGKRLLVFGGFLQGTSGSNDLWSFDREAKTWKEVKGTGELPPKAGVFRWVVTNVEDNGNKVEGLVVQAMVGNNVANNDTFRFVINDHAATWTKLKVEGTLPTGFAGLMIGAVGYEPKQKAVMLFGGLNYANRTISSQLFVGTVNGDAIKWEDKTPTPSPPARYGSQFGTDPVAGRLFVVSGTGAAGALTDIWVLHMNDARGLRWVEIKPEGNFTGRQNGALLVDVPHNRIFVWGGSAGGFAPASVSTLSFDDEKLKWEEIATPPEVQLRTSIYGASDPVTGESFIGFGRSSTFMQDLWSFQPAAPKP